MSKTIQQLAEEAAARMGTTITFLPPDNSHQRSHPDLSVEAHILCETLLYWWGWGRVALSTRKQPKAPKLAPGYRMPSQAEAALSELESKGYVEVQTRKDGTRIIKPIYAPQNAPRDSIPDDAEYPLWTDQLKYDEAMKRISR